MAAVRFRLCRFFHGCGWHASEAGGTNAPLLDEFLCGRSTLVKLVLYRAPVGEQNDAHSSFRRPRAAFVRRKIPARPGGAAFAAAGGEESQRKPGITFEPVWTRFKQK